MQLVANDWIEPTYDSVANLTFQPPTPSRNDTTDGFFQTFRIGVCRPSHTPLLTPHTPHFSQVGGVCAEKFTPQASYWCSNDSQGGGPGPYYGTAPLTQKAYMGIAPDAPPPTAPLGLVADSSVLPNSPYSNPRGALVHSWRQDRWFSWIFGVGNSTASDSANPSRYLFDQGGHQGSRGGKRGQVVLTL